MINHIAMKNILYFALFIFSISSCTISKPIVVSFDEPLTSTFENLNGTKDELFIKANSWATSTFKDAKSVIDFNDKESGVIIGKYLLSQATLSGTTYFGYGITSTNTGAGTKDIFAKIEIRVKDNRCFISVHPLGEWKYQVTEYSGKQPDLHFGINKEQGIEKVNAVIASFESAMRKSNFDF